MGDMEVVRMHVTQALTRVHDPDARDHLRAVLTELNGSTQRSINTCPWCGLRGLSSRLDAHDCPNRTIDDTAGRIVSATFDADLVDDPARVGVAAHLCNPDVDFTVDVSTGGEYLRVALCESAAMQFQQELAAIIDAVD